MYQVLFHVFKIMDNISMVILKSVKIKTFLICTFLNVKQVSFFAGEGR